MEHTGIKPKVIEEIRTFARKYNIDKVILFGSRARGDYRRTSDIDLAVVGGDFARFALDVDEETSTLLEYDIVDMIGYIGFKRKLSDDVIKERMQEILSKLKKDSRAVYSTYAELYYVTKEEKYIYKILKDLKSKDEDIRHHILYTIDGIIIENNLKSKKLLNDHKQLLQKMEQKLYVNMEYEERYNHIFRERLIRSIRKTLGKSTEIIYPKERNFYERLRQVTKAHINNKKRPSAKCGQAQRN